MEAANIIDISIKSPSNDKLQIWKWDPVYQTWTNLGKGVILYHDISAGKVYADYLGNGDSNKWSPFNKSSTFLINKASKMYLDMDASCKLRTSSTPTAFSYWTLANGIVILF